MNKKNLKKKDLSEVALMQDMAALLKQSGIDFSLRQLEQSWLYHTLLRRHNPQLNLTRIHNFKNMVEKLYVDSILPGTLFDLPSPLLDIGTGPGMPGIPLKIAYPHLEIILSESRQKRVTFLEMVIQKLKLQKISAIGRSITPRFQIPVAGVITRALESMEKTLGRVDGCLETGGIVLFMKGPRCDDEIVAATQKFKGRYNLIQDQSYQIPHTPHNRRLVVFERIDRPFIEVEAETMKRYSCHSIESEQNAIFKDLKKLLTAKGIKKQQMALVFGEKPVKETLKNFPGQCDAWITGSDRSLPPAEAPEQMPWYRLSPPLFKALDLFGTDAPILRVKTRPILKWDSAEGLPDGLSLLLPFQDPENVGVVIRSAVAFGVNQVILLEECAHPFLPKAVRASAGAVFHASLFQGPSIKDLPLLLPLIALSPEGKDISQCEFADTAGLLPGVEGGGLPEHLRRQAFSIPIQHEVESLNAAAATVIALYLWSQSDRKI
ncbi:MAG: 16S rRNA (guanine(527)-N(7))-methyltransferase RsmG [Pseudomonadota bacterium]